MGVRITKAKARELKVLPGAVAREDLRLVIYDLSEYYLLPDGKVLIDLQDAKHALLFDTEEEYTSFRQSVTNQKPVHMLDGFPSSSEEFLNLVGPSAKKLETVLGVQGLDFSLVSLKRIDSAIRQNRTVPKQYFAELYPLLVPYASQTILSTFQGTWVFKKGKGHEAIEPFIALPNGRTINVFFDLYVDAEEDFKNFSVYFSATVRTDNLSLL